MINPRAVQDHKACPVCQNALQKKWNAEFYVCRNCGLIIRRPVEGLDGLYKNGWQAPLENLDLTGGTTQKLAKNYTSELIHTLGLKNLNGKSILDFGSGRGEMAFALKTAGANVISIDPYSFEQLKEKGLNAFATLEEVGKTASFDGAIAIDIIEHLADPLHELKKLRRLLHDHGWLYLSTPNVQSLNAHMNKAKWREAQNPSHLLLYTPRSLENAFQIAGFKYQKRLRWRVNYSESKWVQAKDWLLRLIQLDGVLRYLVTN